MISPSYSLKIFNFWLSSGFYPDSGFSSLDGFSRILVGFQFCTMVHRFWVFIDFHICCIFPGSVWLSGSQVFVGCLVNGSKHHLYLLQVCYLIDFRWLLCHHAYCCYQLSWVLVLEECPIKFRALDIVNYGFKWRFLVHSCPCSLWTALSFALAVSEINFCFTMVCLALNWELWIMFFMLWKLVGFEFLHIWSFHARVV